MKGSLRDLLALTLWDVGSLDRSWLLKDGLGKEERAGVRTKETLIPGRAWLFKGLVLFLLLYKVLPRSHDPPSAFACVVGSI